MVYHIMIQDKFIDGFIEDIYAIGEERNNKFWIRGNSGDTNHINTYREIRYIGNNKNEIKGLLESINPNDNIFIHWYDEFIAEIIINLPNKIAVFFWGGEIYEIPFWHNARWVYENKTFKYVLKTKAPKIKFNKNIISSIFKRVCFFIKPPSDTRKYLERTRHIHRIDYLICSELNIGEIELVKKLYPGSTFTFLHGFYDINYDTAIKLLNKTTKSSKIKILFGNSATYANNHLDAICLLKSLSDTQIYCPLSYGDGAYKNEVIRKGHEKFKNNFIPVTNYLSRTDYINFLNSIDILFMYHNRSQAWGNIATALTLGKPVFIKRNNPLWKFINAMGLTCYDADLIAQYDLHSLIVIEKQKKFENLEKLNIHISKKKRLQDLKSSLEKLLPQHESL